MPNEEAIRVLLNNLNSAEKKFQDNEFVEIKARLQNYRNNKVRINYTHFRSIGGVVLAE